MQEKHSARELSEQLRQYFAFSSVEVGEEVGGGYSTINLSCTADGRRYFLKCYRDESHETAVRTIFSFQHFRAHGIPVLSPLEGSVGTALCTVPIRASAERMHCVLFPWSDGVVLREATLGSAGRSTAARVLAAIHSLPPFPGSSVRQSAAPLEKVLEKLNRLEAIAKERSEVPAVLDLLQLKRQVLLSDPGRSTADSVLLHGDYHPQNLLFHDSLGSSALVCDLDDVTIGDRFLDVFSFVSLGCWDSGFSPPQLEAAREFIQAYLDASGLPHGRVVSGFMAYLYDWCASSFMEQGVLSGRQELYALVLRDLRKLAFYRERRDQLLQSFLW